MKTQVLAVSDENAIGEAAAALKAGRVIAFPTDTVYGIAASAFDEKGIEKLFEIKGREHLKAIAVLIAEMEQLPELSPALPEFALQLAEHFWPGALTLVLPALPNLPQNLSPFPTIGVRMPDHEFVRNLIRHTGPLATTSANLSGKHNSTNAQEVIAQLAGKVERLFDGGKTPGPIPSTVVDCTGEAAFILREGVLKFDLLRTILGDKLEEPKSQGD